MLAAIQTFLRDCRNPAVLEYGDEIARLIPGEYALETRAGKVWIEVWCKTRSIARRILAIERHSSGALDCTIQCFGGKPGKLSFLDLDRPQTAHKALCGIRQSFSEQFRRMLLRQFPGWDISALSSGMDLQRSFSSIYPRARVTRGNQQVAALACPSAQDESAMLTFALIWLDHVRTQGGPGTQTLLALFFPDTAGSLSAQRLRWLTGKKLEARLFRFNNHGSAGEVDPRDLGNLETRVSSRYSVPSLNTDLSALLTRLRALNGVGCCPELSGAISVRCRGVEFARIEDGRILLGIETKREIDASHLQEVEQFAAQMSEIHQRPASRMPTSAAPALPERWLESCVRADISLIDPTLLRNPIHSQVLTCAAADRDLIDLLAVSRSGRLAVLELKASEDIYLPLQALDYWMRIAWHAQEGELEHLFPGIPLDNAPPRLLLVAPAMSFHSSNATILRYLSPQIEVDRVGVNSDWHQALKVVFRLQGAESPISHRSSQ